jgi:hypothetical protein
LLGRTHRANPSLRNAWGSPAGGTPSVLADNGLWPSAVVKPTVFSPGRCAGSWGGSVTTTAASADLVREGQTHHAPGHNAELCRLARLSIVMTSPIRCSAEQWRTASLTNSKARPTPWPKVYGSACIETLKARRTGGGWMRSRRRNRPRLHREWRLGAMARFRYRKQPGAAAWLLANTTKLVIADGH